MENLGGRLKLTRLTIENLLRTAALQRSINLPFENIKIF